jgi:hypothetical protein
MVSIPNITAQKVFIPAILFALLNSGLVWFARKNSHAFGAGLLVNTLIFILAYYVILRFALNKSMTQADIVVPALLFVILTPGVLLTLPPGPRGILTSGETSGVATIVHTFVYALAFAMLRSKFPQYY